MTKGEDSGGGKGGGGDLELKTTQLQRDALTVALYIRQPRSCTTLLVGLARAIRNRQGHQCKCVLFSHSSSASVAASASLTSLCPPSTSFPSSIPVHGRVSLLRCTGRQTIGTSAARSCGLVRLGEGVGLVGGHVECFQERLDFCSCAALQHVALSLQARAAANHLHSAPNAVSHRQIDIDTPTRYFPPSSLLLQMLCHMSQDSRGIPHACHSRRRVHIHAQAK